MTEANREPNWVSSTSANKSVIVMTQALGSNYGGILQAYALQRKLRELGLDAVTNDSARVQNRGRRVIGQARSRLTGRVDSRERRAIEAAPRRFVSEHIATLDLFRGRETPDDALLRKFDGFVVGSDQVWRAAYSDIRRHLLDFVPDTPTKISYAASFGTEQLDDYGDDLMQDSQRLAGRFDAISVREDSGVNLCRDHWGVRAEWHIDPTLLIPRAQWLDLIEQDREVELSSPGTLLTYILDEGQLSSRVIDAVVERHGVSPVGLLPPRLESRSHYYADPSRFAMISVPQWLRGFTEADYVITDSFHGCVFSIIFNKPFIAIGNYTRGLARFTSLLKLFGLEERLVTSEEQVTPETLAGEIDWVSVNARIDSERARSVNYLRRHLV